MNKNHDLDLESSNWKIVGDATSTGPPLTIVNMMLPIDLPKSTYDYDTYTPVVLAPINKLSAFVLSEYFDDGKLGLRLVDLRLVDDQIVSSINFTMRGHQSQLVGIRNELVRVCDSNRIVGLGFLFRKIYYANCRTLYFDKILKPKQDSTLRRAINVISATMMPSEPKEIKEK